MNPTKILAFIVGLAMLFVIKLTLRGTWDFLGDAAPYIFFPILISVMIWGFWYERRYRNSNSGGQPD